MRSMGEYATIRIYRKDFDYLLSLMLKAQAEEGRRLDWADFISLLVEKVLKEYEMKI